MITSNCWKNLIRNGRTEWSPIRSVITSTITDRIRLHKVLLLSNHKNYNFREEKSQVIKRREILHSKADSNQNAIDC